MKHLLAMALLPLLCVETSATPIDRPEVQRVMKDGAAVTGERSLLLCYIPRGGDLAKHVEEVAKMIGYARKQHKPLVLYSPDSEMATRTITLAFTMIRKDALRGLTVVCAIGKKNENYIRPIIEATGAKLFVVSAEP